VRGCRPTAGLAAALLLVRMSVTTERIERMVS
jgi:hypothetical protein